MNKVEFFVALGTKDEDGSPVWRTPHTNDLTVLIIIGSSNCGKFSGKDRVQINIPFIENRTTCRKIYGND